MRLLNSSNLQFQEFFGDDLPKYAIFSHTWEAGEVSFHEMRDGTGKEKAGYSKILGSCALAAKDGWKYVWIDTCCIDKTSSAELTEAINSMYEWYRKAEVCYAYLTDVMMFNNDGDPRTMHSFRRSRWFTRGWTLQELLAPSMVIFYECDWKEIGTRLSLSEEISSSTGIAHSDVVGFRRNKRYGSKEANIGVKMSWASKRRTTRIEDTAYCLLGIFGVNMPLLYGEGNAAFIRLQLEILKISDDETIFAWDSAAYGHTGLLATSPAAFRVSGGIRQVPFSQSRPEYSMTNKGLRIELLLSQAGESPFWNDNAWEGGEVYAAALNCSQESDGQPLEIYLESDMNSRYSGAWQFTRVTTYDLHSTIGTVPHTRRRDYLTKKETTIVYVKQKETPTNASQRLRRSMLSVRYPATLFRVSELWPVDTHYTMEEGGEFRFATGWSSNLGAVFGIHNNPAESFAILVTDPGELLGDLAVTLVVLPLGTETFGNGKILEFFNSKDSRIVPTDGKRCDRIRLLDGDLMTWGHFDRTCRFDRISKLLPSGSSVSVAVRPHNKGDRPHDDDMVKQWVVDITVDPKGGLPWPPRTAKTGEEEAGEESQVDINILSRLAYDLRLHPLQLREVAS